MGAYSTTVSVLTPAKPKFMNVPTASAITPKSITTNWVALNSATQWELMGFDAI